MGVWRRLERWFPPEPDLSGSDQRAESAPATVSDAPLNASLDATLSQLRREFSGCYDVVFREVEIAGQGKGLFFYIDGLVDKERLEESGVVSLLHRWGERTPPQDVNELQTYLARSAVTAAKLKTVSTYKDLLEQVLKGRVGLLVDGVPGAVVLSYLKWERRQPEEPDTEATIRGPREGFTEYIRTNTALLRRRIRTVDFRLEKLTIGEITRSDVVIAYIRGLATDDLIKEVRRRLSRIKIDGVLESGYLEEFLEDQPFSPFSQVQYTERPDVVAASLLEGRAAILTDGTPFALIVPTTFFQLMQAAEDHYERWWISSALRLLRYGVLLVALVLPSLYVAITTFHPEMIPTSLLVTISAAREGIPFPAVVEAISMELAFEVLREAGLRLPRPIGQAVSIVGALVIGQAAVQAGLVSAPMVIVVALTGIASFTAPRYNAGFSLRLLRFPLILLGSSLGLFGVVSGLLAIAIHLCSLRSFGVPYLTPLAPMAPGDWKDVLYRAPRWGMVRRPGMLAPGNSRRVAPGQAPKPPEHAP